MDCLLSDFDNDTSMEYVFALYELERVAPKAISHVERLFMAADQFPACLESSGLFCYFELQPQRAQDGIEAMQFLKLPEFEGIIRQALIILGLDENASEIEISNVTKCTLGTDFEKVLAAYEKLETIYHESEESVDAAIRTHVRACPEQFRHSIQ